MIIISQNGYKPVITNPEKTDRIKIKSAITSKYAPLEDAMSNFLET